jgi:Ni/Co efflux regulator RcnB
MSFKTVIPVLAAALGAGTFAFADPPHPRGNELPPGLAKQGKMPPGHARKIWGKGQHLPPEYRDVHFQDWERYDLGLAPAGYHWVRVDRDAYLVEVASGLIAQAMIGVLLD